MRFTVFLYVTGLDIRLANFYNSGADPRIGGTYVIRNPDQT
jgi:hypothetical protein